mmetsp:Transcript_28656/g.54132  ORF Transcript_28656/g.54132 Transcript_28656/m.54132 type:complete len:339 (-) Transcript_28656:205-1221(-)
MSSPPEGFEMEKASLTSENTRTSKKRTKPPRACRIPFCNVKDLENTSRYCNRHRICDAHLKALSVDIDGKPYRFCQKCSRLHELRLFDFNKHSCRSSLELRKVRHRSKQQMKEQMNNDESTSMQDSMTTDTKTVAQQQLEHYLSLCVPPLQAPTDHSRGNHASASASTPSLQLLLPQAGLHAPSHLHQIEAVSKTYSTDVLSNLMSHLSRSQSPVMNTPDIARTPNTPEASYFQALLAGLLQSPLQSDSSSHPVHTPPLLELLPPTYSHPYGSPSTSLQPLRQEPSATRPANYHDLQVALLTSLTSIQNASSEQLQGAPLRDVNTIVELIAFLQAKQG